MIRKRRWKKFRKNFKRVGRKMANTVKDVGTSTTRIVTDVALDVGNVATGFRFEDEFAHAKRKMSEAGVRTAAEAIERNHYGFLPRMEAEVQQKVKSLIQLRDQGQRLELLRGERGADLFNMLAQVNLLSQMSLEARSLLGRTAEVSAWKRRSVDLDGIESTLRALEASTSQWDEVGRWVLASGIAGVGSALAEVGSGRSLAKAAQLAAAAKTARGAQAARLSKSASKLAKIGRLAGRASGVLAVATVGIDIGMSVARLERRKDELQRQLKELEDGLAEANEIVEGLESDCRDIDHRIRQLLTSTTPAQTEESWDGWVAATRDMLRHVRNRLVSLQSIEHRALRLAQSTRNRGYGTHRVAYVASIDPRVSLRRASAIIARADKDDATR